MKILTRAPLAYEREYVGFRFVYPQACYCAIDDEGFVWLYKIDPTRQISFAFRNGNIDILQVQSNGSLEHVPVTELGTVEFEDVDTFKPNSSLRFFPAIKED